VIFILFRLYNGNRSYGWCSGGQNNILWGFDIAMTLTVGFYFIFASNPATNTAFVVIVFAPIFLGMNCLIAGNTVLYMALHAF
jgi:hypothetical protein